MATTIYLTNVADTKTGAGGSPEPLVANLGSRGAGMSTGVANTTSGGTFIPLTRTAGGNYLIWFTPPLAAVSISASAVTVNYWMSESNMSANVSACVAVELWRESGGSWGFISTVLNNNRAVELPVTTRAAQQWTPTATATSVLAGDALAFYMVGGNFGTMASGHTFNGSWGATSGGVDGDTFLTFTETITAQPVASPSLMLPNRNVAVIRR